MVYTVDLGVCLITVLQNSQFPVGGANLFIMKNVKIPIKPAQPKIKTPNPRRVIKIT